MQGVVAVLNRPRTVGGYQHTVIPAFTQKQGLVSPECPPGEDAYCSFLSPKNPSENH